jgi:adenylate kinase
LKKLFLIIGAPGSGKTTDAQLIAKNNSDITHYSTGDMLRDEVAKASELGLEIDSYISQGLIVPISIAIKTITNALKNSLHLVSVIEVKVSEETAKDRVLGRARGADDNTEVFDNRLKIFTEPLAEIETFYTSKNLLKTIDGEREIEEIVSEMEAFIKTQV